MTFKQGESCLVKFDGKWQYAIYNKSGASNTHLAWLLDFGNNDVRLISVKHEEIQKDKGEKLSDTKRVEHNTRLDRNGI